MKRALVVCPGRGSYGASELGYFNRDGRSAMNGFVEQADALRQADFGLEPLSALDLAAKFDLEQHLVGRNAGPLIFTCSVIDAALISADYDIVAVAGNSMGWYTALLVAGALEFDDSFRLIQTISLLHEELSTGGQLLYPLTDEQWLPDTKARSAVASALNAVNGQGEPTVFWSIKLGGFAVLGGTEEGLARLAKKLPNVKRGGRTYPLMMAGHAAYHTPLLENTSNQAVERFADLIVQPPRIPLIDGRGHIFKPYLADPAELYSYTFVHQVLLTYDFTHSIRVGLREFGPDCIILLGPGDQLGGPLGQIIVGERWQGMNDRAAFTERQKSDPFLLSMGRAGQFEAVAGAVMSK